MKKSDIKKLIIAGAAVAGAVTAIVLIKRHSDRVNEARRNERLSSTHAYITSGGLSAYAAALYLIRDCGIPAQNVHIFTSAPRGCGDEGNGYICRRGKIITEKSCDNLFDLLDEVSSLDIPDLSVCAEILNIYGLSSPRTITFIDEDKNVTDISKIRIDKQHKRALISLLRRGGEELRRMPLRDALPFDFFESQFWKLIRASYGFDENSSAYELAMAIKYTDDIIAGTLPADFDRGEEIIQPLRAHLEKLGADIHTNAVVTDIDLDKTRAEAVHFTDNGVRKTVYLNENDICIVPTDEMVECESLGSFSESAPRLFTTPYALWEKMAEKNSVFKSPSLFFGEDDSDMTEEFTITLSNRLLPELIDSVTCGALGEDGILVLDNSNWKLTVCALPSGYFKNQSEDTTVIWGSAARFDREGEYCGKAMTDCCGAEILYELVHCLNLADAWEDICETVINVIPCHRRFGKSFLAPTPSKLEIIPTGLGNLAVSGDFAEDDGTVFTEEYSVTTARKAAYTLMRTKKSYRCKAKAR